MLGKILHFVFHVHKWSEPIKAVPFTNFIGQTIAKTGTAYDCRCEKCGKMRTFKL